MDYSWSDEVAAIVHAWYSGNEAGNAIADVLYGNVNPSGRMPLTFPEREIDIPAWYNTTSVNGKIHYREDIFVGYKHYQARQIPYKWAFGYVDLLYLDLAVLDFLPSFSPHQCYAF